MITLDLGTLHQSRKSGNVTGVIYVELESGAFPDASWSDFPVIILGWWGQALLELEATRIVDVVWRFMDGPYSLTLNRSASADSRDSLAFAQVRSSVVDAAERLVAYCELHQMVNKDLDVLRRTVDNLKANHALQWMAGERVSFKSNASDSPPLS